MNCSRAEELFDDYLSGALEAGEESAVLGHVRVCVACRALLEDERVLREMFRELPEEKCPDAVVKAVWERTAGPHAAWWRRLATPWLPGGGFFSGMLPVGVAAAAVVLVMLFYPHSGRDRGPSASYTSEEIQEARRGTELALSVLMHVAGRSEKDLSRRDILQMVTRPIEESLRKTFKIPEEGGRDEKT